MATARFTYDSEIRIDAGGEDSDIAVIDGQVLGTVIEIPASQEWEPETYDLALQQAGWRRTSEWSSHDVSAEATVEAIQ